MARRVPSLFAVVAVGLAVAALLVVVVAPRADSSPDGLEHVAADTGIDAGARPHALEDGPFADYQVRGVDGAGLGTAVAGLVGVAVTFLAGVGALRLVRRRRDPPPSPTAPLGAAPPG